MSAFFIAINRDRRTFDSSAAGVMLAELDRFGRDGKELVVRDNFAIGYQRFWTVSEEQGERQPLYDSEHNLWLMFQGRIDNREQLCDLVPNVNSHALSDARLLIAVYLELGEQGIQKIVGPFVFVLYFASSGKVLAARDAMGGRYLVYKITAEHILIATYEMALVAHPTVEYRLNDQKVARIIANLTDDKPASTIAGLTPLNPGQQLCVTGRSTKLTTFYLPDPKHKVRLESDQAYADEFKRLLNQAVARRLRSIGSVGSMLSGGLDSIPISILAAQQLKLQNKQLQSYSWVFDNHPEADERRYSESVCADFSIEPHWLKCDDVWPQFDQGTHRNPILPFSSPYSEYNQSLLRQASDNGVTVVLSGVGGDLLYTGTESIFYELLLSGQFAKFWSEFSGYWHASDSKLQFIKRYLLSPILRRWLEYRDLRRPLQRDYLNIDLTRELNSTKRFLAAQKWSSPRPQQYVNVLGSFQSEDINYGKYMEAKYDLERRFPFRDRDLVEFMLAIPSAQLSLIGRSRPIVKQAFRNEFRSSLIKRNDKTNFTSVILDGIRLDQRSLRYFEQPRAGWQRYVKQCYFTHESDDDAGQAILKWQCGYYQYWKTVCYTPLKVKLGVE